MGKGLRRHAVAALEDDAHQFHAGARTGVQGEGADLRRRTGGNQQDAAHRSVTGDAGAGDNLQILPGQFERGHDADIGGAGGQLVGATRREAEFQVEPVALGPMQHTPDQRRSIQITDGGYARPLRDSVAQPLVYQTVCRRREPACWDLTISVQTSERLSLEQIQAFLDGSGEVGFKGQNREEVYGWVNQTLRQQRYEELKRSERGVVRRYVEKMTGLSRAQTTRLITVY